MLDGERLLRALLEAEVALVVGGGIAAVAEGCAYLTHGSVWNQDELNLYSLGRQCKDSNANANRTP